MDTEKNTAVAPRNNDVAVIKEYDWETIGNIVLRGDLSGLNNEQLVGYYKSLCEACGLDPRLRPFQLLNIKGKLVMYCDRSGAAQLNKLHRISHKITSREVINDCYVVTAVASLPDGRHTESIGAVPLTGRKGVDYCNAMMSAETKAKRRSTLDIVYLGILDESEIATISGATKYELPDGLSGGAIAEARVGSAPRMMTTDQEAEIRLLADSICIDDSERAKTLDWVGSPRTYIAAEKMITALNAKIDSRIEPESRDDSIIE